MQSSYLCVLTVYKAFYFFRPVSVSDKEPFQVDSKNVKERFVCLFRLFVLSRLVSVSEHNNKNTFF